MRKQGFLFTGAFMSMAILYPSDLIAHDNSFSVQSDESDMKYDSCLDEAGIFDDWARVHCASQELERQATLQKRAYNAALEKLDSKHRKLLERSQQRWIAKKDRECYPPEYAKESWLGTLETEKYRSCLAIENSERIKWLDKHYLIP